MISSLQALEQLVSKGDRNQNSNTVHAQSRKSSISKQRLPTPTQQRLQQQQEIPVIAPVLAPRPAPNIVSPVLESPVPANELTVDAEGEIELEKEPADPADEPEPEIGDEPPQKDTHSSEPAIKNPTKAKAVFNFEGQGDELSFEKGQSVIILEYKSDGWCYGQLEDGQTGVFPENYVKPIHTKEPKEDHREGEEPKAQISKPTNSKVVSLFDDDNQEAPVEELNSPAPTRPSADQSSNKKTFSYIPQMPPEGFAGLRKTAQGSAVSGQSSVTKNDDMIAKAACRECGCEDYSENVFKRGSCNNCFHFH